MPAPRLVITVVVALAWAVVGPAQAADRVGAESSSPAPAVDGGTFVVRYKIADSGGTTLAPPVRAIAPGRIPIVGDFVGDTSRTGQLEDILWYTPGPGGDALWETRYLNSWVKRSVSVSSTYTPIVGRFTSDQKDDIFWYAPGPGPDALWDFNEDGTITKSSFRVDGTYTPIVGRFTSDQKDDIFWYAPGPGPDALWDFTSVGVTKRPLRVDGTYVPVVGWFAGPGPSGLSPGGEDVLWYAPGQAPDALWDFGKTGLTKRSLRVDGSYVPVAGRFDSSGRDSVIWYAPGTTADHLWHFDAGGTPRSTSLRIDGTYLPLVDEVVEPEPDEAATRSSAQMTTTSTTPGTTGTSHPDTLVWFGAGALPDVRWDFADDGARTVRRITISGDLRPVLGGLSNTVGYSGVGIFFPAGGDIIDRSS